MQHARAFFTHPDTELCAVVARTEESARRRARQFATAPYTSIAQMLECERPDLVSLCLPNLEHFEPTMTVLRAGVPTLAEKPLVFDLDEADALLAEAARQRTFFAINFNQRYAKAVQLAKQAIDDGRLGDIVFAVLRFGGEGTSGHHPYADIIETQCHMFDQLEHLIGPITSVSADMTDAGGDAGPGTMAISLRFECGAVGALVGSYRASYAHHDVHRLEITGSGGRVLVSDTVSQFEYQAAGSETAEVWRAGYIDDDNRQYCTTMDHYVDALVAALRAGEPPPVPATAGRRALLLAQAVIESHEIGRRVAVDQRPSVVEGLA